ncbi:cytokine-dependent hematopoietic cell linker [Erinaceus europaeus]|uniref:Cytokine-dependent hematopoietic cell linker n=1 Tax=Erinaceus europaeus TaxID=9365 RepID=A0ABM3X6K1_ERIEU|nr:cytokine-dependent hematopoietic cell linker [Erinaceus europaeus]
MPDGARVCSEEEYEDPELPAWQSVKILPARPIKESEYADTRYFKSVADLSLHPSTPNPMEHQAWKMERRPEGTSKVSLVDQPMSRDLTSRSQHIRGDRATRGSKTPLPPPRPLDTLPKKYQPLPPEPLCSWSPLPLRHPFPEGRPAPRSLEQKKLLVTRRGFTHLPCHKIRIIKRPLLQLSAHREAMQPHPSRKGRSPTSCDPCDSCKPPSWRAPYPVRADAKQGISHNEWYIGDLSRQAVEEALVRENKDGTFLVRDCSTKSRAEPYVLVVFYRSKVYNVKIRFLERNQQFALGTGRRGDEKFDSVEDIIEHYKYFPIVLIDGKDKTGVRREQCYLTQPLPLHRHCTSQ